MTDAALAPLHTWLAGPMARDVSAALDRLRRAPDVRHIAIMPDVHLSADVCIGVALATSSLLYPQAVGGDIGCGMLAVAFDGEASALGNPEVAAAILDGLVRAIPARRHNRSTAISQPADLSNETLSHPHLESLRRAEGALEFATLGSGNHFIELQADDDGRLWLMLHSGSRAIGPAIRDHHLARAQPVNHGLRALEASSGPGTDYLHDVNYARRYAAASRRAMAELVEGVLTQTIAARLCWETLIATDHNHVALESHYGRDLWVHRKGAMSAQSGEPGVLPGSMGTVSFHVAGRGHAPALCSSAHGAGRALRRTEAFARISESGFRRQMAGVWYDLRLAGRLRDEAPAAYKDVRAVLRAQKDLVKRTRTLRPVLNYKAV
jgi:tRNA-splicing ligase RtcB (3'-phosphate/5'-hydroxy nucleic acid ligase)